ncbi:hypothetical protein [Methyloceanibacter sp.]|uniref:hypothetical protein n=1 Tax=Methyloceanibacter sp. TaxID=1965321 RepID=UPI003D6D5DCF
MSITRVMGVDKNASLAASLRWALPKLLFGLLIIYNTLRLFRHAMWRDELQALMLAEASNTPLELFAKLKYEGHPGLWHLLLWVITRFTTDPIAMQVLHLLIALGVWVLVWRFAPFRPFEKFLLILSYYLFWEYFIVSRNYALAALLGFGFIALSLAKPEQRFWPWVVLGLLANTTLFATIWSLCLGAFFALRYRHEWRSMLGGGAVYAAMLALAIATMITAPDYILVQATPKLNFDELALPARYVVSAFLPFYSPFAADALRALGGWAADLASTPFGIDPAQHLAVLIGRADNPLLTLSVLAAPILACWSIVRDPLRTAEYAAILVGTLLFAQFWHFPGSPRHHGFLFIALIGTVWMWRGTILPERPLSPVWIALLVLSALGGLTTLAADTRPFSQGRNAAAWLERHHLKDALLISSRDYAGSTVAGYLQRPLYYLECECYGTYIEWSTRRKHALTIEEAVERTARVMKAEGKDEAYLIFSRPEALRKQTIDPDLGFTLLKRFPPAIVGDETFRIYRVRAKPPDN